LLQTICRPDGFLETHSRRENNKFKFLLEVPRISLNRSKVVQGLWEYYLKSSSFRLWITSSRLVVTNHKLSKCLESNGNPHKPLVRNLLKKDFYTLECQLFFFLSVFVLYSTYFLLENKKHDILFIGKSKNTINDKKSVFPLNNITYIILE